MKKSIILFVFNLNFLIFQDTKSLFLFLDFLYHDSLELHSTPSSKLQIALPPSLAAHKFYLITSVLSLYTGFL